ncbi:MAG TPA: hypothetical protein VIV12_19695 [Streptosporangiaceae bacterium]
MGTQGPQPVRWPEHLPVGELRIVRWSAHYDQTVAFYRDIVGLPVPAARIVTRARPGAGQRRFRCWHRRLPRR